MDVTEVPQEGNRTLGGHRKALYAKDAAGRMVIVASRGSEIDEIVTMQAIARMDVLAAEARQRVLAGKAAPLEYWMYARRMDVALLSQMTSLWQWRIRRHFKPRKFTSLPQKILMLYVEALGINADQLRKLP